jgi:hypothetical protein
MSKADENDMPDSDQDLGSFEGKYPDSLFNKTFLVNGETIGYVAKDTKDVVVIFTEANDARYDVPRSEIISTGGSITLRDPSALENYRQDKDSPLPVESLRPSADEIRSAAGTSNVEEQRRKLTPEAITEEALGLSQSPRSVTATVSRPEGYVEPTEPEIISQIKAALAELKRTVYAGSKVAKDKIEQKRLEVDEKQAKADSEKITNMGYLAVQASNDFEKMLSQIGSKPYSVQANVFEGLITLMDYQRGLVVARRDLALRFQEVAGPSVSQAVSEHKLDEDADTNLNVVEGSNVSLTE